MNTRSRSPSVPSVPRALLALSTECSSTATDCQNTSHQQPRDMIHVRKM